jgi:hypothetical protein
VIGDLGIDHLGAETGQAPSLQVLLDETLGSQSCALELGFLRGPQQNFARERLRCLGHDHGHGVGYV